MDWAEVKPGFGRSSIGLCWFHNKLALRVFFVAPISVIIVGNILMFLHCCWLLWRTGRTAPAGRGENAWLHLRLLCMMGLSWLVGLLAGWLDTVQPLWFIFLLLNALQGLFILVFFTCTKKTFCSIRDRLYSVSTNGKACKSNESISLEVNE